MAAKEAEILWAYLAFIPSLQKDKPWNIFTHTKMTYSFSFKLMIFLCGALSENFLFLWIKNKWKLHAIEKTIKLVENDQWFWDKEFIGSVYFRKNVTIWYTYDNKQRLILIWDLLWAMHYSKFLTSINPFNNRNNLWGR